MNEYRDFIDTKSSEIINKLNGTITPVPANTLYRDFIDIRFEDVINAIDNVKVKSFNYIGTGSYINNIRFPSVPKLVLSIQREYTDNQTAMVVMNNIQYGINSLQFVFIKFSGGLSSALDVNNVEFNDDIMKISSVQGSDTRALNTLGVKYTVYYI